MEATFPQHVELVSLKLCPGITGPVRGAEAGQVDSSHTTHPKYLIHAHMETSSMGVAMLI